MDEESRSLTATASYFSEIGLFDKWFAGSPRKPCPGLPEQKCVVVLRVRRFKSSMTGNANRCARPRRKRTSRMRNPTGLIRTERAPASDLRRMIWSAERLAPRRMKSSTSSMRRTTLSVKTSPLRHPRTPSPGSKSFIEAMDRADAIRRHYLRLLMVLQGSGRPYAAPRPVSSDQRRPIYSTLIRGAIQIRFVRDARMWFGRRPTFREWQRKVNARR